MLKVRVIPTLLWKQFGLVKGVGFDSWRRIGPVLPAIKVYNQREVDELVLVDIVAHPWWWMGHWQDDDGRYTTEPWFDDFRHIPRSMHDEFAEAAVQHGTVVEINIGAVLLNRQYPPSFMRQYLEYLAGLRACGVSLSIGSDCHGASYDVDFDAAAEMLAGVGFREEDLWRLPPRRGGHV